MLMDSIQEYVARNLFGEATDTLDRTGQIVERQSYDHITRSALEQVYISH